MRCTIVFLLLYTFNLFSQDPCKETPSVYYGGKIYNTVKIGDQCWLKENLDIGAMILGNQLPSNNQKIEKYYYNNDSLNNKVYGAFYLWNEAMQYKNVAGGRGICPEGWHIPTKEEFDKLCDYVQNNSNALKISGVGVGLGIGTNSSGFSSFLSGLKGNDGYFSYQNSFVRYWTSTSADSNNVFTILLYFNNGNIGRGTGDKEFGYCVRCIKDNATEIDIKLDLPMEFSLLQNYPNPFNPSTAIRYKVQAPSHVTLKVYDVLGNEVATLVDELKQPGEYNSQFSIFNSQLSSGVYFYRLTAGNFFETKKMMFIK